MHLRKSFAAASRALAIQHGALDFENKGSATSLWRRSGPSSAQIFKSRPGHKLMETSQQCGKECSGSYCSDICELSDKAPPQDTEMPPLPALVSGYSQSSTSSQCSTPESSPFSRPSKAGEQDVAVLDLGEPAAAALSRTSLNFDYSYEVCF